MGGLGFDVAGIALTARCLFGRHWVFWTAAVVTLGMVLNVSCALTATKGVSDSAPSDMAWAGFAAPKNLAVVRVESLETRGRWVAFAVTGSPGDVDEALRAADFLNPTRPGLVSDEPVDGVDLTTLKDPQYAFGDWISPDDEHISRKIVRGHVDATTDLLHVWAFDM